LKILNWIFFIVFLIVFFEFHNIMNAEKAVNRKYLFLSALLKNAFSLRRGINKLAAISVL